MEGLKQRIIIISRIDVNICRAFDVGNYDFDCCVCLFLLFCMLLIIVVISPELVLEVETRMKRNYMPHSLLPTRKHSRHTVKPHLPTVQELHGKSTLSGVKCCMVCLILISFVWKWCDCVLVGRESQKSSERYSPVRRASDGSPGSSHRTHSPKHETRTIQQEYQQLQRGLVRHSPPLATAGSSKSIPGSYNILLRLLTRFIVSLKIIVTVGTTVWHFRNCFTG